MATGPAAAGPERAAGKGVAPTGDVELVPLDGSAAPGGKSGGDSSESPEPGSSGDSADKSAGDEAGSGSPATPDGDDPTTDGAKPGRTKGSSPTGSSEGGTSSAPSTPSAPATSTGPGGPAKLSVGDPQRKPAADRWCEKVTVSFRNTGGSPVRSGTVTFGTHVIGALGVDWATIKSTVKLPAPIGAGERVKKTWPVCVEAWRVPLGMHVETQDVSVKWK
ncbi:hypothetical protein ACFQ7F_09155 [Streptomyces sp. NPDC056486]|uniref:hypothetical protein n=1 Tax=Streptomyces sp. NPDC056486 TaxID=3345835 RepID=UPI00368B1449